MNNSEADKPIDWTARRARALAHLAALKAEREAAQAKKREPKYIAYDWKDEERT